MLVLMALGVVTLRQLALDTGNQYVDDKYAIWTSQQKSSSMSPVHYDQIPSESEN